MAHAERVLDSLGHVVARQVGDRNFGCALFTEYLGQLLGRLGCHAVDGCIGHEHTLGLHLIGCPGAVEAQIVGEIALEYGAVEGVR